MTRRIALLLIAAALGLTGCVNIDADTRPYVEEYRDWKNTYESISSGAGPLRQVPGDDAGQIETLEKRMLELYADGEFGKCEQVIRRLIRLEPDQPDHWYHLACVQSRQGNGVQALESLSKAIDLGFDDPDKIKSDADLAALRATGEYRRLLNRLTEAGDQDKQRRKQFRTLYRRSMIYFRKKRWKAARDVVRKMLELRPQHAVTWYNLACAESRLGNHAEAGKALGEAVDRGYADFHHMQRDPDLAAIRGSRTYRDLMSRRDEIQRDRAQQVLARLKETHGDGYLYDVDHEMRLVFATDIDRRMLEELKSWLVQFAKAQRRDLFGANFDQYVSVVVPRKWKYPGVGGYYSPTDRTLTARAMGMVMAHEFTHALHFGDQDASGQNHPIWITEGLATLFETSRLVEGRVMPLDNYRLILLKRRVARDKVLDFRKLAGFSHAQFMRKSSLAYAQVRYMFKYLHDKGLLKRWYDRYMDTYDEDETGIAALEAVCGQDVDKIQADWAQWVGRQKPPPMRIRPNQAYIGIRMAQVKDGLKLVDVVPGSGAEKAGLAKGDVVIRVDDFRVVDSSDLLTLVSEKEVGEVVEVEFRRDGEYRKVSVELGPMPQRVPRKR
jgi:tetratricopeptide (TPR) repeat protein